jgi:hypothetical protein
MTNEVQNFWLNQAKLRKKMVWGEKKKQEMPAIYNTIQDKDIEDLCKKIQANNYQI